MSATVAQIRRNTIERDQFLEAYGALTLDEVVGMGSEGAVQAEAVVARWLAEHKVFAVRATTGAFVYPRFQFDDRGRPRTVVADVLAALPEALRDGGWQLAFWWDTPTDLLSWRRPVELIDEDSEAVVAAARNEARDWS